MVLYVDGIPTTSGIRAGFKDCLEYTGDLIFGQDGDFTAGSNLEMEQDTVAVYNRAWAESEISSSRRYVVSDNFDLYALWIDTSGRDSSGNKFAAVISTSSEGSGVIEAIDFEGWSYSTTMMSRSWVFPSGQNAYYFSTEPTFVLSSK